ncbi:hypothetical protein AUF78_02770 [archaeon 13_1_20CM_2_51_12]|nr:MAG: hypothetical protein AUF78_02770 [archaeon 13_1_20CM_2_51_12]
MEEKRPRARHRFDFSGETRKRGIQTTTDQILRSLNRQAQFTQDTGEDQENLVGESSQLSELDQLAEYSGSLRLGRWLFVGMLLAIPVFLWAFGLFPRILYVDTVGSIDNLISMIPRVDIFIIVTIWVAALVIGLLGRRARHVSKTRLG